MKKLLISCLLLIGMNAGAQTLPTYLDETKPVEQRIDDVLSRMTLDEKIAVIHAQSKFSAAGACQSPGKETGHSRPLDRRRPSWYTPQHTVGQVARRRTDQ